MKKMIVFLFMIVFLIDLIFAQEIELIYPKEVAVEEEFEVVVDLKDFEDDVYDIKIDILDGGKRVGKMLNGDLWKSTVYYVNDVIDFSDSERGVFKLKVVESCDGVNIGVKVRDSNGGVDVFEGYFIDVVEGGEVMEEFEDAENKVVKEEVVKEEIVEGDVVWLGSPKVDSLEGESIKTSDYVIYESKAELMKKYAVYGFALLLAMFCVLLAWRKLD